MRSTCGLPSVIMQQTNTRVPLSLVNTSSPWNCAANLHRRGIKVSANALTPSSLAATDTLDAAAVAVSSCQAPVSTLWAVPGDLPQAVLQQQHNLIDLPVSQRHGP